MREHRLLIDSFDACPATGSTMRCHDGSVASIHSLRLHAPPPDAVAGKVVTGSSQSEARSSACSTSRRSMAVDRRVALGHDELAGGVAGELPVDRPSRRPPP